LTTLDKTNDRRANIYFNILSPAPGTFLIALHFKGRDKPILEMDLKIDDLLEKVSWRFLLYLLLLLLVLLLLLSDLGPSLISPYIVFLSSLFLFDAVQ
jgi:hypothetical protein